MLFNSVSFAVFLVVVFAAYRMLGRSLRAQNWLLLVAGYVFYGWWDVRFLHLLVISTCLDFSCGLVVRYGSLTRKQAAGVLGLLLGSAFFFVAVDWRALFASGGATVFTRSPSLLGAAAGTAALAALAALGIRLLSRVEEARRRRLAIVTSISGNLLLLASFKYFNFFAESLRAALSGIGITVDGATLSIILPVGISFYTFQSMAYAIDVYRKEIEPSQDLLEFGAFVVFFPQLEAGPISRARNLLPQFQKPRPIPTRDDIRQGLWLMAWGLYKKMVVADNVAPLANSAFAPFDQGGATVPSDGLRLLFALYAFALQIYGDFSGYSDIARGVAKLFGFELTLNFNLPYFATSPSDFWRRWHISLSTWLRDYLYIALGGNRGGAFMTYRNLFLTMLLGGLWHGASWTFVVWGAYHGLLLIAYRPLLKGENRDRPWVQNVLLGVVMFHLTCLGWLFFRARNLDTVWVFLQSIVGHPVGSVEAWDVIKQIFSFSWFLLAFQLLQIATKTLDPMPKLHWFLRLNVWVFILMSLVALSGQSQEFIYFDF